MKSLQAFLNPQTVENKEVVVSKRFMEDGKPVAWVIKPITSEENDRIMKKHMKRDVKRGTETFNRLDYVNELVASAVVYPDLNNSELQSHWGVLGATQLLGKMLYQGEFALLSEEVQKLSGLDITDESLVDEAKN